MRDEIELGPVYGGQLLKSLPIGDGTLRHQLPSRADLEQIMEVNERFVAGYEILMHHYRKLLEERKRNP